MLLDRDIIVVTSINGTFSFDAFIFLYENFQTDILQIFRQYEFLSIKCV